MPDCAFCAIVSGAAEAAVVLASDDLIAFLDVRPVFPGHTLVVPRDHVTTLSDLPDHLAGPLLLTARRVAAAQRRALGAEGAFIAVNDVVSQSVPHVHVHVVPRRRGDGLRGFFWPRTRYEGPDDIERVRAAIAAAI
jgi:histidine triad (HIT) family protein